MDQNQLEASILFPVLFSGGGAAFSPANIAGLQLWFKSDAGTFQDSGKTTPAVNDGDVVGAWADQSGNGNDALQATTANKPLLKLAIANGRPVIRFDGTDDRMSTAVFAADLAQPNTIFVVVEMRNIEGDRAYVYNGLTAGKRHTLFAAPESTPDEWEAFAGGLGTITNGDVIKNTITLMSVEYNGVSSEMWENGVSKIVGEMGVHTLDGLIIGSQVTTNPLDGDIAEILLYNAALTDAERIDVETYLNERYAIF